MYIHIDIEYIYIYVYIYIYALLILSYLCMFFAQNFKLRLPSISRAVLTGFEISRNRPSVDGQNPALPIIRNIP